MNPELFIVRKIAFASRKSFSFFIIRIAIAAVALSLATMIIATSMVNGFQKEIRNKVLSFQSHLQIVPYSYANNMLEQPVYKNQDFYIDNSLIPDVRHIQVTALKGGLLKTDEDFEGIILKGVGPDFDWSNFTPYLKQGAIIKAGTDGAQRDILISRATANRMQIKMDDKVVVSFIGKSIRNRPFRVKGIYETGMGEFDERYALVDIATIQDLNNWGPDTVGGFDVFLKSGHLFKSRWKAYYIGMFGGLMSEETALELSRDPIEEIAGEVYGRLSNSKLDVITIKDTMPGVFDWLDLQTTNEMIILVLMIIVATINMVTALLILILERTNMIGIMKALGASNVSIRRIFIYYSAVIIGIGLLAGNVAGIGLCLIQKYGHLIKLPQDSYYLTYAPVDINWAWILWLNLGTVIVTLAMLTLPSLLISKITPVKAIRFE